MHSWFLVELFWAFLAFLKGGGDGFRPVSISVGSFSLQFLLCCVSQSSDRSRKAVVMFVLPDIHVSVVSVCTFCYVVFFDHQKELLIDILSINTCVCSPSLQLCYVVFPNYQKELLVYITRGVGSCNSCIFDFLLICLSLLSFFERWWWYFFGLYRQVSVVLACYVCYVVFPNQLAVSGILCFIFIRKSFWSIFQEVWVHVILAFLIFFWYFWAFWAFSKGGGDIVWLV